MIKERQSEGNDCPQLWAVLNLKRKGILIYLHQFLMPDLSKVYYEITSSLEDVLESISLLPANKAKALTELASIQRIRKDTKTRVCK